MRLTVEDGELSPSFTDTVLLCACLLMTVRPHLLDMEQIPAEFLILDTPAANVNEALRCSEQFLGSTCNNDPVPFSCARV